MREEKYEEQDYEIKIMLEEEFILIYFGYSIPHVLLVSQQCLEDGI